MARKILEVKTGMPAGIPMRAGTSKASMARTNMMSIVLMMAGRISGRVTRRRVVKVRDPAMIDASSSDMSMERKAADIRRKTSG